MKIAQFSFGSTADLHQRGNAEANPQAIDRRTRKHLLREARKAKRARKSLRLSRTRSKAS